MSGNRLLIGAAFLAAVAVTWLTVEGASEEKITHDDDKTREVPIVKWDEETDQQIDSADFAMAPEPNIVSKPQIQ